MYVYVSVDVCCFACNCPFCLYRLSTWGRLTVYIRHTGRQQQMQQQSSPFPLPPTSILKQSKVNQSALLLLLIDKQSRIEITAKGTDLRRSAEISATKSA